DRLLEEREVQAGAAGDVDDRGTRAKLECFDGPQALAPLGVPRHGVEPRGEVVVLRLLAVCLDQAVVRAVDLAHGVDSTAALIAATSPSMTRRIRPCRTPPGIARITFLSSTSTHIIASVRPPSCGASSIPQRASDVPIGPANATERGASTRVTF